MHSPTNKRQGSLRQTPCVQYAAEPGSVNFPKRFFTLASFSRINSGPAAYRPKKQIDCGKNVDPFRAAAPFWGQRTYNLTGLSPKRDCGSKWDKLRRARPYPRSYPDLNPPKLTLGTHNKSPAGITKQPYPTPTATTASHQNRGKLSQLNLCRNLPSESSTSQYPSGEGFYEGFGSCVVSHIYIIYI